MLARHGIRGVELARGVEDDKAFDANFNNRVTANGLVALFRVIHERSGVLQESAREMLDILFQQEFRSGIPAGIPADVRSASRIANKTGEISVAAHDAGLVFLPGPRAVRARGADRTRAQQRSPHGAHRARLDASSTNGSCHESFSAADRRWPRARRAGAVAADAGVRCAIRTRAFAGCRASSMPSSRGTWRSRRS